ncbi:flocculation protein FLO11-like [Cynara cardunculus var. scolymus]|uniref:flocculation protein FLO11-like n=1 Tax=Cynara cardunculus var. scolymus TaxID=59895 RepID=UPI000D62F8DF|nr:flocculation protein FLO11-like [Cynara cardunculus var. scolymus]
MASKVGTPSKAPKIKKSLIADDVTFSPCNFVALLDHNEKYPNFFIIIEFLRKCPLFKALTFSPKMSKSLLLAFWATCIYDASTKSVHASVLSPNDISFTADDLRRVLELPTYSSYDELISVDNLHIVATTMGYVTSALLPPSSSVPSQQDTVVHTGNPLDSTLASLYDFGDDSDSSPFRGPSSPPLIHGLSPKIDDLDDIARMDDLSALSDTDIPYLQFILMDVDSKPYLPTTSTTVVIGDPPHAGVDDTDTEPLAGVGDIDTEPLASVADTDTEPHADIVDTDVEPHANISDTPIGDSQGADGTESVGVSSPVGSASPIKACSPTPAAASPSRPPSAPGFQFSAPSPPEMIYALPTEVVDMLRGFTSQCQLLISQQATLDTDLSGKLDCVTSELHHHSAALTAHGTAFSTLQATVDSLDARMAAISDSQSSISDAVADLRAQLDSQAAINEAILQSLADLHSKMDAQTQISKLFLARDTEFTVDLGPTQFTEEDRVMLAKLSRRVESDYDLLGGLHRGVSRLLRATCAPYPRATAYVPSPPADVEGPSEAAAGPSPVTTKGEKTVDPATSVNGDDDSSSTSSTSSSSTESDVSVEVGTIPSQDDVLTTSGDLVPTHREGKAPMTTDEEAAAAKAAKSARHQSEVPAADRLVLKASLPQETDLQLLGISSEDAANSIAL